MRSSFDGHTGCLDGLGFYGSSADEASACNAGKPGSIPGLGRSPRDRLPTPVFMGIPGCSDGKEAACNAGDLGSIPGLGNPLEKEMATHPNILAWKIPWTKEPSRLQSMGSQRVGDN